MVLLFLAQQNGVQQTNAYPTSRHGAIPAERRDSRNHDIGLPENLKSGIFEVVFTISKKSTSPMCTLGNGLMYP